MTAVQTVAGIQTNNDELFPQSLGMHTGEWKHHHLLASQSVLGWTICLFASTLVSDFEGSISVEPLEQICNGLGEHIDSNRLFRVVMESFKHHH